MCRHVPVHCQKQSHADACGSTDVTTAAGGLQQQAASPEQLLAVISRQVHGQESHVATWCPSPLPGL